MVKSKSLFWFPIRGFQPVLIWPIYLWTPDNSQMYQLNRNRLNPPYRKSKQTFALNHFRIRFSKSREVSDLWDWHTTWLAFQVVRLKLEDNKRIVGTLIPNSAMTALLTALDEGSEGKEETIYWKSTSFSFLPTEKKLSWLLLPTISATRESAKNSLAYYYTILLWISLFTFPSICAPSPCCWTRLLLCALL